MFNFKDEEISDNCKPWVENYSISISRGRNNRRLLAFTLALKNKKYKGKLLYRMIWENYWRTSIPKCCVVHHIDENPLNNEIENLKCIPVHLHDSLHNKGKKLSIETRKKLSEAFKGKDSPMLGKRHTEKTLRKMSEVKKGKKPSEKTKRLMSIAHMSENLSEETLRKMSEAKKGVKNNMFGKPGGMLGKHFSEESKRKISERLKGRIFSEETKKRMSEARKLYLRNKITERTQ